MRLCALLFLGVVTACQVSPPLPGPRHGSTERDRDPSTTIHRWFRPGAIESGQWASYRRRATAAQAAAKLTFKVLEEADHGHWIEVIEDGATRTVRLLLVDLNGRRHTHDFIIYRALTRRSGGPVYEHPTRTVLYQHQQWTDLLFPLAAEWKPGRLVRVETEAGRFDDALIPGPSDSENIEQGALRYYLHRTVPFAGTVLVENGAGFPSFELLSFGTDARGELEIPPPAPHSS